MSSLSITKALVRSPTRVAPLNRPMITTRVSRPLRRTYVTERPILPQGGSNRPLIIAALVGIPALAYFIIPSRSSKPIPQPAEARRPNLDPAATKRDRDENEPNEIKYIHPEHKNPGEFKPAFGQVHRAKRVDSPPDGRNHQALIDRERRHD